MRARRELTHEWIRSRAGTANPFDGARCLQCQPGYYSKDIGRPQVSPAVHFPACRFDLSSSLVALTGCVCAQLLSDGLCMPAFCRFLCLSCWVDELRCFVSVSLCQQCAKCPLGKYADSLGSTDCSVRHLSSWTSLYQCLLRSARSLAGSARVALILRQSLRCLLSRCACSCVNRSVLRQGQVRQHDGPEQLLPLPDRSVSFSAVFACCRQLDCPRFVLCWRVCLPLRTRTVTRCHPARASPLINCHVCRPVRDRAGRHPLRALPRGNCGPHPRRFQLRPLRRTSSSLLLRPYSRCCA